MDEYGTSYVDIMTVDFIRNLVLDWLLQSVLAAKRGAWDTILRWLSRFSLMMLEFLAIMASLAAYFIFTAPRSHHCFCTTIFYLCSSILVSEQEVWLCPVLFCFVVQQHSFWSIFFSLLTQLSGG